MYSLGAKVSSYMISTTLFMTHATPWSHQGVEWQLRGHTKLLKLWQAVVHVPEHGHVFTKFRKPGFSVIVWPSKRLWCNHNASPLYLSRRFTGKLHHNNDNNHGCLNAIVYLYCVRWRIYMIFTDSTVCFIIWNHSINEAAVSVTSNVGFLDDRLLLYQIVKLVIPVIHLPFLWLPVRDIQYGFSFSYLCRQSRSLDLAPAICTT